MLWLILTIENKLLVLNEIGFFVLFCCVWVLYNVFSDWFHISTDSCVQRNHSH